MCYDTRSINSLKQEQITQSSIECLNECKECYDRFIITRVHSYILSNEIKSTMGTTSIRKLFFSMAIKVIVFTLGNVKGLTGQKCVSYG